MIDMPSVDAASAMRQQLVDFGFNCDTRSERLRWSPGAVTTDAALDALDEAVGVIVAGRSVHVA